VVSAESEPTHGKERDVLSTRFSCDPARGLGNRSVFFGARASGSEAFRQYLQIAIQQYHGAEGDTTS